MKDMTNSNNGEKAGVSPVVAAMVGALAGAGVAIAGAVALSNEENRTKVKGVINRAKIKLNGFAKGVHDETIEKKEEIKASVKDAVDSLDSLTKNTKKKVSQTAKLVKDVAEKQVDEFTKEMNKKWQK